MHHEINRADWLWMIGGLTQLHGIAFDAELLRSDLPPPLDVAGLIRAGAACGLVLAAHTAKSGKSAAFPTHWPATT